MGHQQRVPVLVLEPFAVEGRASGRGAHQEPTGSLVGRRPDEVGHALEAEHRVERVEGHGGVKVGGVGRRGGDEGGGGTGFVDPFLKELALRRFLVLHQHVVVDRFVQLALGMIDAKLSEQRVHTKGSGFVGNDGDDALTEGLVLHERSKHAHKGHCGGDFHGALGAFVKLGVGLGVGEVNRFAGHHALGHGAAQCASALFGVGNEFRNILGHDVGIGFEVLVREGKAEVGAHELHGFHVGLLLLMRRVAPGKGRTEPVALDGANQHGRGLAFVGRGSGVGSMEFGEIVTAHIGAQGHEVVVGEVGNQGSEPVGVEQFLADGGAVSGHDALLVAVDQPVQTSSQQTVGVTSEEVVPRTAPEHLDDVPAGTSEAALQFLDDLGVATNGPVETLQVAVHRHHDVIEALTTGKGELRERFGLVGFTVAHRVPHTGGGGRGQAAVFEVAVEAGLVDGRHGAQTHADGRELPEVGHQTRVRVAGKALATDLLSELLDVLVGQSPFEPSTSVDAGGSVALPVEVVAGRAVVLATEEVVEAHLPGMGGRSVGGDVAADAVEVLVRPCDHHHGVPAYDAVEALFHRQVTGVGALVVGMNRVEVRCFHHFDVHACVLGGVDGGVEKTACFFLAPLFGNGTNGVPPFLSGNRVRVGLRGPSSKPHGVSPVVRGQW